MRMGGLVGYGDVESLLREKVGIAEQRLEWQQCRSSLLSGAFDDTIPSVTSAKDSHLLRSWLADGCPKFRGTEYVRFFRDLDSWTEYWDIYHPETHGRFYFGDGQQSGLLGTFLPSPIRPRNPVFDAWKQLSLNFEPNMASELHEHFEREVCQPQVAEAVLAVDELVLGLVHKYFTDAKGSFDGLAYLDAMERFGKDILPPSPERYERVPDHDARKRSSLHHTIEGDIMWFGWAVHLECTGLVAAPGAEAQALRCAMMAGIALGCSFDFAFRGRRRTRKEYLTADAEATARIWTRAQECMHDFASAAREVRELFRIREYGDT
jgi:hypothetical protein